VGRVSDRMWERGGSSDSWIALPEKRKER
jgi:hypothetical protein